jgi:potassium efflux system protein
LLSGTIIANLTGRYNLSKIYLTLCFFGILTAYLLYWAWILFTNLLNVSVEAYKFEGNQNFKDKVLKLKNSIPVYLKFFLIGGWIIIVFRNFYFYERISGEITQMVEKETLIGDFTFSLEKLILFFFIILISAIISKLISLFSDRFDNSENDKEGSISKAGGLSNWMLLIRLQSLVSVLCLHLQLQEFQLIK